MLRGERAGRVVAALAALGLVVRLIALAFARHSLPLGDALVFHEQANLLAAGRGFINPLQWAFFHRAVATAEHPPLFPVVLSAVSVLGGRSVLAHQVATCVLGAATVGVVAVAGRQVGGRRVGALAGGLAAVSPALWLNDTQVMSETLYALTLSLFLVAIYAFQGRPSGARAACIGGVVGLAVLTRAEALVLLLVVVIPVLIAAKALPLGQRAAYAAVVLGSAGVVMSPWVVRNLVTFEHPVLFTINGDTALAGANCPAAYYGPGLGGWVFACSANAAKGGDESTQALALRHRALDYVGAHLARVPVVLLAREGRAWSLFRPLQDDSEPRGATAWLRVITFVVAAPLSLAGLWLLRRRRRLAIPLAGMAVTTAATAAAFYGGMRFRVPWELAAVILGAVALDAYLPAHRTAGQVGAPLRPAPRRPRRPFAPTA